ncbi:hypothetical protein [uncultured Piscinibacter sp.]|uniref:hypothetical protein n=1 Tax=uncultured Piscinibacter sp. TaxID=1131835 RepID=UPI002605B4BA|nr:hypothetical protein [uncultured Piscinibacter sp.]
MLKKELAKALGISPAMVRKLELRGMPTHDADLAKTWREANLDYTRLPSGLMKLHDRRAARAALLKSTDPRVEKVQRLAKMAESLLRNGQFELIEPDLRAAMRAVPGELRPSVLMDMKVFDALVGDCIDLSDPESTAKHTAAQMEIIGRFWYAVAAGDDAEYSETINAIISWEA